MSQVCTAILRTGSLAAVQTRKGRKAKACAIHAGTVRRAVGWAGLLLAITTRETGFTSTDISNTGTVAAAIAPNPAG